jgi:hypothetical protein
VPLRENSESGGRAFQRRRSDEGATHKGAADTLTARETLLDQRVAAVACVTSGSRKLVGEIDSTLSMYLTC